MRDKHDENVKENNTNNFRKEPSKEFHPNVLLNILLSIIVIVTVITGSIIYYSIYKYSKEDVSININDVENQPEQDDVSTVADIIDTALSTNTAEENVSTEEATSTTPESNSSVVRKYYYSNYCRS